jgi:hypothetical protein
MPGAALRLRLTIVEIDRLLGFCSRDAGALRLPQNCPFDHSAALIYCLSDRYRLPGGGVT